ncbi:MAG: hypothetical protein R3C28_25350 [Pirellulaceae bacterium]
MMSQALDRDEHVEQAHFFRTLTERSGDGIPLQELLENVKHEILVTTKLPLAIEYMASELRLTGCVSPAMSKLGHYFTAFQTFLMQQAESDKGRFDFRTAIQILQKEAEFRSSDGFSRQGLFLYRFEVLCRNRLSYDQGLAAAANDPAFDERWQSWIGIVRRQIGIVELADMVFVRSEFYEKKTRKSLPADDSLGVLFGEREGRIAWANRRRDPLLLFGSLQRHLGYPPAPRPDPPDSLPELLPQLARRVERMEQRMKLLEEEQKGGIDITKFYRPS